VEKVKEIMRSVHFSEFQASFKGVGAFPNLNRINVVWIGITDGQDQLNRIFHQIEPSLRQIGLSPDNKGFSPHLTIARVRSGRNIGALADFVTKSSDLEFGSMIVKYVRLKKSTLTSKGPIYSTLHEMQAT
jgi:2'-5' RNA ligase